MFNKKLLSTILILFVLIASVSTVLAKDTDAEKSRIQHELKSIENGNKILAYFVKNYNKEHLEDYAGSYIDEDGDLNVNLVEEQSYIINSDKIIKDIVNDDNVKFHYVKYSQNDLDKAIEKLNKKMVDFDIRVIARDDE